MALGDSITAGLFATSSEIPDDFLPFTDQRPFTNLRNRLQRYMGTKAAVDFIPGFEEYRGRSYATGVDIGVETLPNVRFAFDGFGPRANDGTMHR